MLSRIKTKLRVAVLTGVLVAVAAAPAWAWCIPIEICYKFPGGGQVCATIWVGTSCI